MEASDVNELLDILTTILDPFLITFVPQIWELAFLKQGFTHYGVLRDYWMNPIRAVHYELTDCDYIKDTEYLDASFITQSCKLQSREFHGESAEWIKRWANGTEPTALFVPATNCSILVERQNTLLVGIICVGIYKQENDDETTLWLRELAVKPEFQGKGIEKILLTKALNYGINYAAKRVVLDKLKRA